MEPVYFAIVCLCILLIVLLFLLIYFIPAQKRHQHASGGIKNHNSTCTKFVFRIPMTKEEICTLLSRPFFIGNLSTRFNAEESELTFWDLHGEYTFYVNIQQCTEFSILRLNWKRTIRGRTTFYLQINPFFVEHLDAEIIPYNMYGI